MKARFSSTILLSIVLFLQGNAQSFESRLSDIKERRSSDNPAQILTEYDNLEQDLIATGEDSLLGQLYHDLSVFYYLEDDYPNAISAALSADSTRSITRDTVGRINTKFNLTIFYRDLGRLPEEARVLRELIALGFRPDQPKTVHALTKYCFVMREMGDYPTAIQHGVEAIRLSRLLDDPEQQLIRESSAHLDLATAYDYDAQYDSAFHHFAIAQAMFEEAGDMENMRSLINNLGNLYRRQGLPQEAIELFQRVLSAPAQFNLDDDDVLDFTNNLALAYKDRGEYDLAFGAIEEAQRRAWSLDAQAFRHKRARVFDNIGAILEAKGDFLAAAEHYQRAITTLIAVAEEQHFSINPDMSALDTCDNKIDLLVFLTDKARCLARLGRDHLDARMDQYALSTLEAA
ncbi:MAG: tetratricopeptide repeat protein, partial [Saprospiraceae bacterium]|nr:tetratricopeptide repeat protein [Saprospiraceae bacterium]